MHLKFLSWLVMFLLLTTHPPQTFFLPNDLNGVQSQYIALVLAKKTILTKILVLEPNTKVPRLVSCHILHIT